MKLLLGEKLFVKKRLAKIWDRSYNPYINAFGTLYGKEADSLDF